MTLLEELIELVKKYGYDPKNGGLEGKSFCTECGKECLSQHVGCDDSKGVNDDGNCTNCGAIENK